MKLNKPAKSLVEPVTKKWSAQKSFLHDVGQMLVDETVRRIEKTKADPNGVKWARWAKSTRLARNKEGSSATGLLFRFGTLRDSLSYRVQAQKVSVRTELYYAQYLQNGTDKMPARPFLGTGPREERQIQKLWKKWIDE